MESMREDSIFIVLYGIILSCKKWNNGCAFVKSPAFQSIILCVLRKKYALAILAAISITIYHIWNLCATRPATFADVCEADAMFQIIANVR